MTINKYGRWALIAGAAQGLGEAFSTALASRGFHLIMVDMEEKEQQTLAGELEARFGINTLCISLDLSGEDASERMMEAVREKGCRLLVYNAAFSRVKPFLDNSPADLDRYVNTNMRTPFQLVRSFAGYHSGDNMNRKGIILMSSLAGIWGAMFLGPYGATKAFNRIFAQALYYELGKKNFDCMACVAGATATPAYLGTKPVYGFPRPHVMDPLRVADGALKALGRKAVYIPGIRNRLSVFFLGKLLPSVLSAKLFNRTVGKMYAGNVSGK